MLTAVERCSAGWLTVAVLVYANVTLYVTAPLAARLGTAWVRGEFTPSHFWIMDVVWTAVRNGALPPLHTTAANFPDGGALVLVGWTLLVAGAPLSLAASTVLAGNVAFLILLTAGAVTAFLMVHRFTGSIPGALLGGLIFGYSPLVLATIPNGHVYSMLVLWVPVFVVALDAALRTGRPLAWLALSAATAACTFENPYFTLCAFVFAAVWLLAAAWEPGRKRILVALGCIALGLLPGYLYFHTIVRSTTQQMLLRPAERTAPFDERAAPAVLDGRILERAHEHGQLYAFSVDPLALLKPRSAYDPQLLANDRSVRHVYYLGALVCLLALLGAVTTPLRETGRWLAAGLLFLALSLGEALIVNGYTVFVDGQPVPLLMAWAGKLVPALTQMRGAYRFVVGLTLCLAVLAALGWRTLGRRLPAPLVVAVGAAVLHEALWIAPVPYPFGLTETGLPTAYAWLAKQPGTAAVVEYPYEVDRDAGPDPHLAFPGVNQAHLFAQSAHHRPLAIVDRWKPYTRIDRLAEVRALHAVAVPGIRFASAAEDGTLKGLGFGWIVLHPDLLPSDRQQPVVDFLDEAYGSPRFVDPGSGLRIYAIP